MRVKHLNLLLTYKCPSQCLHCCYYCGLEGEGLMTTLDVKGYLHGLRDQPLESVWIYGGEPFLYRGVLSEVVKIAKQRRIARIGVLTNGYWAKSRSSALKKLCSLKQAGLNAIVVSTDGFHARRVPPELAMNAAKAAREVGIETVSYSVSFLQARGRSNPFNDLSERIWTQVSQSNGIPLREDTVMIMGRAADKLLDYCECKHIGGRLRCRPPVYIGGTMCRPHGIEIDPDGWVMICPGLSLGNAKASSLSDLIARHETPANIFWQSIRQQGAEAMVKMARDLGFVPNSAYASICHLCYEARKFLRPHYPEYLAPASCYQEPVRQGRARS
jgi:hypothetical protein